MSYVVTCHKCQAPFDALQASWCTCLVTERSIECPSCGNCFCLPDELKRPLVLLVDDETIIQRVATRASEGLGYGVLVRATARRASSWRGTTSPTWSSPTR